MVWFRVDDGFPTSRKVLSIPKRRRATAIGVWTLAGAWCARELTDGTLPRYALEEIPSGPQASADLVSSGLWIQRGPDFEFHDWAEYQPSREEVLKEREAHAARQKAYRDRKKAERDASRKKESDASRDAAVTPAVTAPRPDPTRPDPTVVPTELPREVKEKDLGGTGSTASRLPADWQPDARLVAWVKSEYPAVNGRVETEKFRDHWHASNDKSALKRDWNAAFRTWVRRCVEPNRPTSGGRPAIPASTTDAKVQATLALADQYAAAEAEQARKEISA